MGIKNHLYSDFTVTLMQVLQRQTTGKSPAPSFSFSPSALYLTGIKFIFPEKKRVNK